MPDQLSSGKELTIKVTGLIINTIGVFGVVASIYFGLKSQTQAINNQWGQEFYKQKMAVYLKASALASRISNLKNKAQNSELEECILEFKTLYGGPMAIMEETQVEMAMVLYGNALDKDFSSKKLQQLALYLSHVLRNESRSTFLDEKESSSHYGTNEEILEKMRKILNS